MTARKILLFDVECDGLLEDVSEMRVFSWWTKDGPRSTTDLDLVVEKLQWADCIIGHNIVGYDLPAIKELTGYEPNWLDACLHGKPDAPVVIDTLYNSFYLYALNFQHGLDYWGKRLSIQKVEVTDWENASPALMKRRCEGDVHITYKLYQHQQQFFRELYVNPKDIKRIQNYLTFKAYCARLQEESKWYVDQEKVAVHSYRIEEAYSKCFNTLQEYMPMNLIRATKKRPAKLNKKDGSLSKVGERWYKLLIDEGLPANSTEATYLKSVEKGNPNSNDQVKAWLFSLGWKPTSFDVKKKPDGTERKIPQVRIDGSDGKVLCPSVLKLLKKEPALKHLEDITTLGKRLALLKTFKEKSEKDGRIHARTQGFTNTLRWCHRDVANLPKAVTKEGKFQLDNLKDGWYIRSCLSSKPDEKLIGADLSSLEDKTKQHFIKPLDPEYVAEMNQKEFDPHLDIAVLSGLLTPEQARQHREGEKDFGHIRHLAKTVNFSSVYGVGARKLSRTLGISLTKAEALLDAYWERNWSVKKFANSQPIYQTRDKQMWVKSPISGFKIPLKYKKDVFSTLNQNAGVYVFDTWLLFLLRQRGQLTAQFHDEFVLCCKESEVSEVAKNVEIANHKMNKALNLNVNIGFSIDVGDNYAEIH